MPALNISNIKDAKLGGTQLSAVYKGCTQIWRADNVITKCHSLFQRVLSDVKYTYGWLSYNDYPFISPFEVEFLVGDEWQSKQGPLGASFAPTVNGVKYYGYDMYGPAPQDQPFALRVRLSGSTQCWSGMDVDGNPMPEYSYPQPYTFRESELDNGS